MFRIKIPRLDTFQNDPYSLQLPVTLSDVCMPVRSCLTSPRLKFFTGDSLDPSPRRLGVPWVPSLMLKDKSVLQFIQKFIHNLSQFLCSLIHSQELNHKCKRELWKNGCEFHVHFPQQQSKVVLWGFGGERGWRNLLYYREGGVCGRACSAP